MAKRTAIIDIGSNSISLVIYEKSSRYAFHLIEKLRSRVRIGEGAYENGGHLRDEAMANAYDTLEDFLSVAKSLDCRKILSVATSALRDAPNKKVFLKKVSNGLKLNIKIIDGQKEAYFGAVAALNLLPQIKSATTIDIGGGSTELAKIEDGKIVDTISLDIGTVRLKELFFDKKKEYSEVKSYTNEILKLLPDTFKSSNIIGIGGTIRALSSAILKDTEYPIDSLHAFEYTYEEHKNFIVNVSQSEVLKLKSTSISRTRYDTIREGSAIFFMVCEKLGAENIITSKAGVREGVYLSDILRNCNHIFPHNFNISIKSLVDRFALYSKNITQVQKTAVTIYEQTHHTFDKDGSYKEILAMSSKLLLMTRRLNIYSNSNMSFGFLVENLNFALSHEQKILIALILKYAHQNDINEKEIKNFRKLLPSVEVVQWLSFILSLTICLNKNKKLQKIDISFDEHELCIIAESKMFLASQCIKKLNKPASFTITIIPN
ncbi:MAG TPA: Ppx/GppA family phosphatase [Campylobacterales bacterium]|nr:Ppx/GppA family phosphatase [Campylobacterales bacterium]